MRQRIGDSDSHVRPAGGIVSPVYHQLGHNELGLRTEHSTVDEGYSGNQSGVEILDDRKELLDYWLSGLPEDEGRVEGV